MLIRLMSKLAYFWNPPAVRLGVLQQAGCFTTVVKGVFFTLLPAPDPFLHEFLQLCPLESHLQVS